jgi:hypothetical protein
MKKLTSRCLIKETQQLAGTLLKISCLILMIRPTRNIPKVTLLVAAVLLLFSSCGGMRNVDRSSEHMRSKTDSSMKVRQLALVQENKASESLVLINDSLNNRYQVLIWPRGKFSYSAEKGFEGTAEKILISGRVKKGHRAVAKTLTSEHKDVLKKTDVAVQNHSEALQRSTAIKKVLSWKTVLSYALVLLCIIAIILIFRFVRRGLSAGLLKL